MRSTNQTPGAKVIPFQGEFYQTNPPEPEPQKPLTSLLLIAAVTLLGAGAALGATAAYNSPDQVELRELKAQSAQLNQVKDNLCK